MDHVHARERTKPLPVDPLNATTGVLQATADLAQELRAAVHDQLRLLVLESERAARSLVIMLAAQVAIGTLLISTWLILVSAGVFALIGSGLDPIWALVVAACLTLAGAFLPYRIIGYQRRRLRFPATLASLRPTPTTREPS
jgi:hypothetical protein